MSMIKEKVHYMSLVSRSSKNLRLGSVFLNIDLEVP